MELNIYKLVQDFGGPKRLTHDLNQLFVNDLISSAAIYKWRERNSLPLSQLNKIIHLAQMQGKRFDLNRYVITDTQTIAKGESSMTTTDRLIIFDTTLRDGEQSPGASMTKEEKIRIARQLERLGVDVIEAGFAAASPGDAEAIAAIAQAIHTSTVCSLARANPKDIHAAGEALKAAKHRRIHTFIATSPIHMEKKLRLEPDQVIQAAVEAIHLAREYTEDVEFSAEDALRSDPAFLIQIFAEAIKAGATTINVPDTVGYATPQAIEAFFRYLIENTPGADKVIWSTHCHDDLGLAVANSLSAILGGARQLECTINGLGERAGNACLEEAVMAIKTRQDLFQLETGIDATQIVPISRLVSTITGYPVQPNKAIVGANAFAHESGIHQDGVLKHRATYEIMSAESVGWHANRLTLGKLSGRNAFRSKLAELGIILDTEEMLNAAFTRFKELADRKREIFDEDLHALISDELSTSTHEAYKFVSLKIQTETGELPLAQIVFLAHGEEKHSSSHGSGPVDAVFKAIEKIIQTHSELSLYSVNAVTKGTESQGEVTVRLEKEGRLFNGQGADTDIIAASAKAYLDAANRLMLPTQKVYAQATI